MTPVSELDRLVNACPVPGFAGPEVAVPSRRDP
jgi:hypothetical protein